MKPFPIHFAIDLEPDERLPDEANKSFDSAGVALERMLSLRSEIEAATGFPAAFGWYIRMDRHVTGLYGDAGVIAVRYKSLLDEAAQGLASRCLEFHEEGYALLALAIS